MLTVPTDTNTGPGSGLDTGLGIRTGADTGFGSLVADSELLRMGVSREDCVARGVTLEGWAATYVRNGCAFSAPNVVGGLGCAATGAEWNTGGKRRKDAGFAGDHFGSVEGLGEDLCVALPYLSCRCGGVVYLAPVPIGGGLR